MNRCLAIFTATAAIAAGAERRQSFDTDPGWDGVNNRPTLPPVTVKQDFGYAAEGNAAGLIGGLVTPAAEPAWYGLKTPPLGLRDRISASGSMIVKPGPGNVLVGFFNDGTVNEWRTPNSLVWRINARGDVVHVHFEYATSKWRAGAGVIGRYDKERDRMHPLELKTGNEAIPWSLDYDPRAGTGTITAVFGGNKSVCELAPGHREDGAVFNRFGILNVVKSVDSPGEIWLGALMLNGKQLDPATGWDGHQNRRTYTTDDVRPWFNFGWSQTQFAGGKAAGELGGRFFRGDCREAARLACYGDRLSSLTMDKPLRAGGRVVLRRGVSDSTTLLGFYHHEHSMKVSTSQHSALPAAFLGVSIEGPSPDGFYFYPVCRALEGGGQTAVVRSAPPILPDGKAHDWSMEYRPSAAGGRGAITVTLDSQPITMPLEQGMKDAGQTFDRFGLVTPWVDGNAQIVFFDDLVYTSSQ